MLAVTIASATSRSLVFVCWEASRRASQACSAVHASAAMRIPRAWSMTGRDAMACCNCCTSAWSRRTCSARSAATAERPWSVRSRATRAWASGGSHAVESSAGSDAAAGTDRPVISRMRRGWPFQLTVHKGVSATDLKSSSRSRNWSPAVSMKVTSFMSRTSPSVPPGSSARTGSSTVVQPWTISPRGSRIAMVSHISARMVSGPLATDANSREVGATDMYSPRVWVRMCRRGPRHAERDSGIARGRCAVAPSPSGTAYSGSGVQMWSTFRGPSPGSATGVQGAPREGRDVKSMV